MVTEKHVGNGVWHISLHEPHDSLAQAVSKFAEKHPNHRITALCPTSSSAMGTRYDFAFENGLAFEGVIIVTELKA